MLGLFAWSRAINRPRLTIAPPGVPRSHWRFGYTASASTLAARRSDSRLGDRAAAVLLSCLWLARPRTSAATPSARRSTGFSGRCACSSVRGSTICRTPAELARRRCSRWPTRSSARRDLEADRLAVDRARNDRHRRNSCLDVSLAALVRNPPMGAALAKLAIAAVLADWHRGSIVRAAITAAIAWSAVSRVYGRNLRRARRVRGDADRPVSSRRSNRRDCAMRWLSRSRFCLLQLPLVVFQLTKPRRRVPWVRSLAA